jgi:hypothetical protein
MSIVPWILMNLLYGNLDRLGAVLVEHAAIRTIEKITMVARFIVSLSVLAMSTLSGLI